MATAVTVTKTNNADIDGLLSGTKWSGMITYSFPDSFSDYASPYSGGSSEPTTSGFAPAPSQMQAAINYAIGLIKSYTNANIQYAGTNGADIMIAQSPSANPTSYAYYPGNYAVGGDIWFGTQYDYTQAKLGNYYFTTALHELGHALGLKHSQETGGPANVAVPSAHDDSEYTVMSYRSYVGASTTTGYTNEAYGYPQTYMANDILALQTMYGANYTTQSSNTVYTWSPTTGQEFINGVGQLAPGGGAGGSANRIYEAVWDGGGVDTYDLSDYTTNLSINLNPGASSLFSSVQLANLGSGHYASGNVYNAYLYNNDARSYIDNAIGGSGNDMIIGNAIANMLNGNSGNDTITGGGANDTIIGGAGIDTAVYSGSEASYAITYDLTTQAFIVVDQRSGSPDGTDTITGAEYFQFADGPIASSSFVSVVIEALGTTSLLEIGNSYALNSVAGGTGPQLKYGGAPVAVDMWAGWSPIGAEQTASGYDVAWRNASAGQYTVWNIDQNGDFVSFLVASVPSNNLTLESLETTFQQDLNGDGTIGPPAPVLLRTNSTTSLVQIESNYFLNRVGSNGTGPELQYNGTPVAIGEFGTWVPYGAIQVTGGYNVAWKNPNADQYTVWNTDNNGRFVSFLVAAVPGNNTTLEALETIFDQDLNGNGTVGPHSTIIQTNGTTNLVEVGSKYFLNSVGSNDAGPALQYNGSPVAVGEFGTWVPYGAIQVTGGYNVAWKNPSADQYTVWNTDNNGRFVSFLVAAVPGNNTTLESLETTFDQDLNGNGTVGPHSTVIQTNGSTSLVLVGSSYFLSAAGNSGAGPVLKYNGSPVVAGDFGTWVPYGAIGVTGGYDVAWKNPGANQYTVWNTDSNGNLVSFLVAAVPGNNITLELLETTFNQDLNGDGTIGLPGTASPTLTALQLPEQHLQENFHLAIDSNDGTVAIATAAIGENANTGSASSFAARDAFAFVPNFSSISQPNLAPAKEEQFSKIIFADIPAFFASAHVDTLGSTIATDAAYDTITLPRITTAALLAHLGDFHFV